MYLRITFNSTLALYNGYHRKHAVDINYHFFFLIFPVVLWQDIMVLSLHMARQVVAKHLQSQEELNVTVTEA